MQKYIFLICLLFSPQLCFANSERDVLGGGDGAGGDSIKARDVTTEEIQEAVEALPNLLWRVLAFHEILASDQRQKGNGALYERFLRQYHYQNAEPDRGGTVHSPALQSIYRKLFPSSGRDAFEELGAVQFKLKPKGACEDRKHQHKDASAFNSDPREICLSLARLKKKIKGAKLATDLLALAGHELAHRMNGDEEEARAFQRAIRFTLVTASYWSMRSFMHIPYLGNNLLNEGGGIKYLLSKKSGKAELCFTIGTYHQTVREKLQFFFKQMELGFSYARLRGIQSFIAADLQAAQMSNFCNEGGFNGSPLQFGEIKTGEAMDLQGKQEMQVTITERGFLVKPSAAGSLAELEFNYEQSKRSLEIFLQNAKFEY